MRTIIIIGIIFMGYNASSQVDKNIKRLQNLASSRKEVLEKELLKRYNKVCKTSNNDSISNILTIYFLKVPGSKISLNPENDTWTYLEDSNGNKVLNSLQFLNDIEFIESKLKRLFRRNLCYFKSRSYLLNQTGKIVAFLDHRLNTFCVSNFNPTAFAQEEELLSLFKEYGRTLMFQISGENGALYFGLSDADLLAFELAPNKIEIHEVPIK